MLLREYLLTAVLGRATFSMRPCRRNIQGDPGAEPLADYQLVGAGVLHSDRDRGDRAVQPMMLRRSCLAAFGVSMQGGCMVMA